MFIRKDFAFLIGLFVIAVGGLLMAVQVRTDSVNATRFAAIESGMTLTETQKILGRPATRVSVVEVIDKDRMVLVPTDRQRHCWVGKCGIIDVEVLPDGTVADPKYHAIGTEGYADWVGRRLGG